MSSSSTSGSNDQLIIGIDFGTTFSGIAYAFTHGDKPDILSVVGWPGLEGKRQPKAPTIIGYGSGQNGKFSWGGQKHEDEVIEGIKLLLDPDQKRPLYLPATSMKSDLERIPKPAVDVAADFLHAIYQHAMANIKSKVPAEYMQMCQRKFVLTVPAVWSDKAKNVTLQAAKKAGIHPVKMIKEPEAAALYTLKEMQGRSLSVGDAFVICDAGGGTVDLISYEITQLEPVLELKELVPGKGGMAGSLVLNKRFEEAVKTLLGSKQYFTARSHKPKAFDLAIKKFDESVKTAFRGDPDEDYFVNFPLASLKDDPDKNLEANCWNMKGDDVKAIFDPLITEIERLVSEQVREVRYKRLLERHQAGHNVKAIFLVGGFGASHYLKSCLERNHPKIQVIQPTDGWAAIAKGAVLSQLQKEACIVSIQASRHYGVSAGKIFDPIIDRGHMIWYIRRGDDLQTDQSIKFNFYRSFKNGFDDDDLVFTEKLIQGEYKDPPTYPTYLTTTNCTLTADLRGLDRRHFKKQRGLKGKTYFDVSYTLVITVKTAVMKFALEIDDQEMGSVSAQYE